MKRLFIHKPLFRLLSPVFSGIIVYLLILLVNNNVAQLQNEFLGEELYVCIGMSYIIQEFSRALLLLVKRVSLFSNSLLSLFLQVVISMILCVVLVTSIITIYYKQILGFSPNSEELWLFNSIFCAINIIYILLFISHQYLYKINNEKLKEEQDYLSHLEQDFNEFKQGINPNLLFESLENLLVLIQQDKDKADDFIDYLATIYRYILSSKQKQLVLWEEELSNTEALIELFNYLPYRNVSLLNKLNEPFLIVPRVLLFIVEQIIRTTIISSKVELTILIEEEKKSFTICYQTNDKITTVFSIDSFKEIQRIYGIYSSTKIEVITTDSTRTIKIPKLTTKESK
ncbi:histidine kinase [Tenacibaculum sp. MEBiC06402]|uniref:histidine kinase n=1 Tax=unclassified Tenacibaculum TaxID=2635139 RepID=UPI003B9DB4EB